MRYCCRFVLPGFLLAMLCLGCQPGLKPVAMFSATPISGKPPLQVQFTDESFSLWDPIAIWRWDFGDGLTSTQENPTHVYYEEGVYTVTLTVVNNFGIGTVIKEELIEVLNSDILFDCDEETSSDVVLLPDHNLKAAILNELSSSCEELTEADMLKLTSLNAVGYGITKLDGLEQATNLVNLNLKSNFIQNIKPLAGMNNLVELDISFNNVAVIEPIAGMNSLRFLDLTCNTEVANWDPLVAVVTTNNGFLEGGSITVDERSVIVTFTDIEGNTVEGFTDKFLQASNEIQAYAQQNNVIIELLVGSPSGGQCDF